MKLLVHLVVLVGILVELYAALDVTKEDLQEWEDFKLAHSKNYETPSEEEKRKLIFVDNLHYIREHNKRYEKGEFTFTLGTNEYADLTTDEFNAKLNGFKPSELPKAGKTFVKPENTKTPTWVNWWWKGAVTRVKNQKDCGSCWAFSSTGALEAVNFFNTSKLVSLSEQNLIDCTVSLGNGACNGGWPSIAMQYVIDNNGIDTEKSYPYKDSTDYVCKYNASHKGGIATGYTSIPWGDDDSLLAAVATVGPISVGVQSSLRTFHLYRTGVYYDSSCSYNNINHAVLLVGYGKTLFRKRPYWTIKNSWGWTWGELGYMRMARNQTNMCGISSEALYPTI